VSEWLPGLASWAGIAAIALALWMLVGLLVAVGFGHLVARDDGRAAVHDPAPDEVVRGEPHESALSGRVARLGATPGTFQVTSHAPSRALEQRGEFAHRARTALQPEAARPVPPYRETRGGHGAC
jgi:hypothetical protein